jgi:HAD superfamily hydrolase (TIGR01509 family)
MRWKLVIFDCDGVLVDSERIDTQVLIEMAAELELLIPPTQAIGLFRGRAIAQCVTLIEERLGRRAPADFIQAFRRRSAAVFERELRPIEGVAAALQQITIPVCVASSAPPEKIELALRLTGLLERFAGRIFSADQVGRAKPDPALFLHAARTLGCAPSECVVVEDSLVGVQAAVAAGMHVLGYADAAYGPTLAGAGGQVFAHMAELPALLAAPPSLPAQA